MKLHGSIESIVSERYEGRNVKGDDFRSFEIISTRMFRL